jgi:membrane protease YdiL (CAAX protease family)
MRKPFPGVWFSLLLIAVMAAGQLVLGLLFRDLVVAYPMLAIAAFNLVVLGLVCAGGYWMAREAPAWGAGRRGSWGLFLAITVTAVGAAVALGYAADLLTRIFPLPPNLARLLQDMLDGPPAETALAVVVVAPLTEELLFRGLILRGLERRYGAVAALLISSAFFALSHFNLIQAIPAFAAGLYLGWLYRATGTLWWPMAAHALYNGLSLALASAFPDTSSVPNAEPMPWPLALAGAAVLAAGLLLTKKWAPLSPAGDSDTVAP